MKILFFSSDISIVDEWKKRYEIKNFISYSDIDSLQAIMNILKDPFIVVADFDSVSNEINKLISSNTLPDCMVVLEKNPAITSGKTLIHHKVKAYGNARMSQVNFEQMIQTVSENKIWTYPELTAALAKDSAKPTINDEAKALIQERLSPKEIEVVYMILDGFCNEGIAKELKITTRTVKAHVSSIFSKLHINDRISLVLLLK